MISRGRPRVSRFPVRLPEGRAFYALLGLGSLIACWQLASDLKLIRKIVASSPFDILNAAYTDFSNGSIWPHLAISAQEWLFGFSIAIAIGIPVGFLIGFFRRFRLATQPWLFALDSTPSVALYPLIVLAVGIGLESKVVMVFLASIFQIVISTMAGVRAVSWKHLELANSFRASQRRIVQSVVLPTMIPFVLTGLRLGSGRSLVGIVVAEFQAANAGIGYYISLNGQQLNTARVFVGLIIIGVFGIIMGEIIRLVENRFDAWRPALQ